jgi:K+-transporting ATPase c subunit
MMASGSRLDPVITLPDAEFQLERAAAEWADDTKGNAANISKETDEILPANTSAALTD